MALLLPQQAAPQRVAASRLVPRLGMALHALVLIPAQSLRVGASKLPWQQRKSPG